MSQAFILLGGLIAFGSLPLVVIVTLRARYQRQLARELVTHRLTFPNDMESAQIAEIMNSLRGLLRPWCERTVKRPSVAFELRGTVAGVHHNVRVPQRLERQVMSQLRRAHPGIRTEVEPGDGEGERAPWSGVRELSLSSVLLPLQFTTPGSFAASLITACTGLQAGEELGIQVVVTPSRPAKQPAANSDDRTRDDVQRARRKLSEPLLQVVVRIAARAAGRPRTNELIGGVVAVLQTIRAEGVYFRRRLLPPALVRRFFETAQLPLLIVTGVVNLTEAGALAALPVGGLQVPGLYLTASRQLAPHDAIPTVGRVLARSTFPGADRDIALALPDRMRHQYTIGMTGSGKSTLLEMEALGDIEDGHGVVFIDPHGDSFNHLADRVPPHRIGDVAIVDVADTDYPVSLNLLAHAQRSPERITNQVVGILHSLYKEFWGPRTHDILRNSLLTLAPEPGMTLCEVPLLLTDDAFRRRIVGQLHDPLVLEPFWADYGEMSPAERRQAIGPVMNKLRDFLAQPTVRNIIGQGQDEGADRPKLDLADALAHQKILLVRLGNLGKEATALIGSVLFTMLWHAVQERESLPEDARPPVFVYIDELQKVLSLPDEIAAWLSEGRKLRAGLIVAHQYLAQLPYALQQAVLPNSGTKVILQTSAHDAEALAGELKPHIKPHDIQNLRRHEALIAAATAEGTMPPVSGRTYPLIASRGTIDIVREASRERYADPRAVVEARILARHIRGAEGRGRVRRERYGS